MTRGLTIGEVARRAGLRPSAIRYYEATGLLPRAVRVSGWRRYGASIFTDLAVIDLGQRSGFSLDELRLLRRGSPGRGKASARWAAVARRKLPDIEALIARAEAMKDLLLAGIGCGCRRIDECPAISQRAEEMAGRVGADDVTRRTSS